MNRIARITLLLMTILILPRPAMPESYWGTDPTGGTRITDPAFSVSDHEAVSDGAGGMILVWSEDRGGDSDIYASRISADGLILWEEDGTAICTASGEQTVPKIIVDGNGGAVIVWRDQRGTTSFYAQAIDESGLPYWTVDGIPIADDCFGPDDHAITADGTGGGVLWGSSILHTAEED